MKLVEESVSPVRGWRIGEWMASRMNGDLREFVVESVLVFGVHVLGVQLLVLHGIV